MSFQRGQYGDAIAHHQRAIALSGQEDERLLISLGQCFFGAAHYGEAVKAYRRGLRAARFDDAGYHLMLADAFHAQGDVDEACQEWKKVLWLQSGREPEDPLAREAREKLGAHCGGGDDPSRPQGAPRGRWERRRAEGRS